MTDNARPRNRWAEVPGPQRAGLLALQPGDYVLVTRDTGQVEHRRVRHAPQKLDLPLGREAYGVWLDGIAGYFNLARCELVTTTNTGGER